MAEQRFRNFDVLLDDLQVGHKYKFYVTQSNGNKIVFTGDYQGNSNHYNYINIDNTDPPQTGVTMFYIYNITNIKDVENEHPVLKGGKSRRHKNKHKRTSKRTSKRTKKRKRKRNSRRQRRI